MRQASTKQSSGHREVDWHYLPSCCPCSPNRPFGFVSHCLCPEVQGNANEVKGKRPREAKFVISRPFHKEFYHSAVHPEVPEWLRDVVGKLL